MRSIGGRWEAQERGAFVDPQPIEAPNLGLEPVAKRNGIMATAKLAEFLPAAQLESLIEWRRRLPRLHLEAA